MHDLDGKLQVLLDAGTEKFVKLSGSFCRRDGEISTYHIPGIIERNLWIYHTLRIYQLLSGGLSVRKEGHAVRMFVTVSCLLRGTMVIGSVPETWTGKI